MSPLVGVRWGWRATLICSWVERHVSVRAGGWCRNKFLKSQWLKTVLISRLYFHIHHRLKRMFTEPSGPELMEMPSPRVLPCTKAQRGNGKTCTDSSSCHQVVSVIFSHISLALASHMAQLTSKGVGKGGVLIIECRKEKWNVWELAWWVPLGNLRCYFNKEEMAGCSSLIFLPPKKGTGSVYMLPCWISLTIL